jgi:hypothetical protein
LCAPVVQLRVALVARAALAREARDLGREAVDFGRQRQLLALARRDIVSSSLRSRRKLSALRLELARLCICSVASALRVLVKRMAQVAARAARATRRARRRSARPCRLWILSERTREPSSFKTSSSRSTSASTLELRVGLAPAHLVAADAGRLLEDRAPVERIGRQDRVDLALFEHGVAARAQPVSNSMSRTSLSRTFSPLIRYSPSPERNTAPRDSRLPSPGSRSCPSCCRAPA